MRCLLSQLYYFFIINIIVIKGFDELVLPGLFALKKLRVLRFTGCEGVGVEAIRENFQNIPPRMKVWDSDGILVV